MIPSCATEMVQHTQQNPTSKRSLQVENSNTQVSEYLYKYKYK